MESVQTVLKNHKKQNHQHVVMRSKHDQLEINCDTASIDFYSGGVSVRWIAWMGCEASVAVLVHLKILVVQLFLSLVEFTQLLCLSFTELFPFSIMSGETLSTRYLQEFFYQELLLQFTRQKNIKKNSTPSLYHYLTKVSRQEPTLKCGDFQITVYFQQLLKCVKSNLG